jgi:hypothetical protein
MAEHFSYASEPHPVWAPLAAKIHEAVWDDVGLEKVQGFVRQWAEEFNQREAEVKKAQEDWKRKAKKLTDKAPERFCQHQLAQAKLLENNPKHVCQPYPVKMVSTPCPPNLELPLPPPHRTLSKLEQWADLAAIHDYYGTGEKVNLWPLEQKDEPLPTNKRDRNRDLEELRKQAVGDHYWHLIEEAGRLAEGYKADVERWLKDLAVPPQQLDDDEPPKVVLTNITDPRATRELKSKMKLATAMCLVQEHPDWSDRTIAKSAGYETHSALSKSKTYQTAAAMARGQRTDLPRGSKDGQTGNLEAWEKGDEEDDEMD